MSSYRELFHRPVGLRYRLVLVLVFLFCALSGAIASLPSDGCLQCHGDPPPSEIEAGLKVSKLKLESDRFDDSVHGIFDCVDCHLDIEKMGHAPKLAPVNCAECHDDIQKDYATSIHGASRGTGATSAASCGDCHGSHYIQPVNDLSSPVFKLNLPFTCARCHENPDITEEFDMKFPHVESLYLESIHGRGLLQMGLVVAPSCNDCHGVHDINRTVHPDSPINRAQIAETCGKCHVGVEETFNQSIHGDLMTNGGHDRPVCTDCHTAHGIQTTDAIEYKALSDMRCGQCHQDRLVRYKDTYHGKALALGRPNQAVEVAACYDCHGAHDVLPSTDPLSKLSADNIVETCSNCHPGANGGFTGYIPHADPLDAENYPTLFFAFIFMTSLLGGVFLVFGVHTSAWFYRAARLFISDSKSFRKARLLGKQEKEWFTRFTPFERFLHLMVVTSFLLLVFTGMPLKFYYADWAKVLLNMIGGVEVARSLHHFGAIVTFLYFALHLGSLAKKIWRWFVQNYRAKDENGNRKIPWKKAWNGIFGPDSMVPSMADWRDLVAHVKWFTGRGPQPQFDRWTYWEKFDYFAVFWGVAIIGVSGLILWFPQFFSEFLPGWAINVALIVHSDEALLAAGFIFTFHFFNTHFRIEKFPMDTVIFSGRIPKIEMLHERKRWYDRLVAEGRLDDFRVKDEWENWRSIARTFGYLFFGLGLILLFLIIYALALHFTQ